MVERELAELIVVLVLIGCAGICILWGIFVWTIVLPVARAVWKAFTETDS